MWPKVLQLFCGEGACDAAIKLALLHGLCLSTRVYAHKVFYLKEKKFLIKIVAMIDRCNAMAAASITQYMYKPCIAKDHPRTAKREIARYLQLEYIHERVIFIWPYLHRSLRFYFAINFIFLSVTALSTQEEECAHFVWLEDFIRNECWVQYWLRDSIIIHLPHKCIFKILPLYLFIMSDAHA